MKLSKQQQILGGVMFLGLIAVGVDRLMPKATAASTEVAESSDLLVEHHVAAAAPAAVVSKTHGFNQRLALAVTNTDNPRSAFEIATVWQPAVAPIAAVAVDTAADQFATNHRLSNTLSRGDHAGAVIDGKLMVIGQSVDGFKLITVTGRSATLSNGRAHVVLNQISR